jgi:hypothetical protein
VVVQCAGSVAAPVGWRRDGATYTLRQCSSNWMSTGTDTSSK